MGACCGRYLTIELDKPIAHAGKCLGISDGVSESAADYLASASQYRGSDATDREARFQAQGAQPMLNPMGKHSASQEIVCAVRGSRIGGVHVVDFARG
jgi:hypothetical protein